MTIQKQTIYYDIKVNSKDVDKIIKKCNSVLKELVSTIEDSMENVNKISSSIDEGFANIENSIKNSSQELNNLTVAFMTLKELIPSISSNIEKLASNASNLNNDNAVFMFGESILGLSEKSKQSITSFSMILDSIQKLSEESKTLEIKFKNNEDAVKRLTIALSNTGVSKSKSEFDSYADTLGDVWNGVKGAVDVFSTFKTIADLANGAAEGIKVLTTASTSWVGLVVSIGIGAIAALTAGLIEYDKVINAEHYAMIDKNNAIKDSIASMDQMASASKRQMDIELGEISVLESYYNSLRRNIDENGVYIGTKEQLAVTLGQLNDAFPQLNAHLDEESQKIVDQNGEVIDLKDSVGELIKAKKAQAYLDAYQDDYAENMKKKNDAIKENIEYQKELSDIKSKLQDIDLEEYGRLGLTVSTDAAAEYAKQFNLDPSQISELVTRQSDLNGVMATNNELINQANAATSEYGSVLEAVASGDYDGALSLINGLGEITLYDPEKGQEQISALASQVDQAKETVAALKTMEENNPEANGAYEEQLALALENQAIAEAELQKAKDEINQQNLVKESEAGLAEGAEHNRTFGEEAVRGMIENGQISGESFSTEVLAILNAMVLPTKQMVIEAVYRGFDGPYKEDPNGPGASFDDSAGEYHSIKPSWSTSGRSLSQMILSGVQRRLSTTLEIGIPRPNLVLDSAGSTEITQNLSFNQPIQKPSDVSRALQKAARDLRKVK